MPSLTLLGQSLISGLLTGGLYGRPSVSVYRAATIDAQLDLATKGFVNQEVALDGGRLVCSRLFKWYRHDFDATGGLGPFLLRYLDDGPARQALAAGATPCVAFSAYDWSLQHPARP